MIKDITLKDVYGNDVKLPMTEVDEVYHKLGPNPNEHFSGYEPNLSFLSADKENCVGSYWFYPQVISTNFRHKKIYFGFTDNKRMAGVCSIDLFDHTIRKNRLRYTPTAFTADTHNNACVTVLPDRRIMVMYADGHGDSGHNNINIRISKEPESIDDFEDVITVDFGTGKATTYAMYYYINGKHYIFTRASVTQWAYTSSDDAVNWSTPHVLLNAEKQWYVKFAYVKDRPNWLRFIHYSNPSAGDTGIRLGYVDFESGNIYDGDGETVLGTLEQGADTNDFTTVVPMPAAADGKQRMCDLLESNFDDVKFTYSIVKSRYVGKYYMYDNGTVVKLCDTGEYLFGASGTMVNCGVWFVDSTHVLVARSSADSTGYDYIEQWAKDNSVWAFEKEIYKELKGADHIRNTYPIIDPNGKVFVWFRGYHSLTGYTDFEMDALIYDVEKETIY